MTAGEACGAVIELVGYVCWVAPAGARRRAAEAIALSPGKAELVALLLRTAPADTPARAKYWRVWRAVVLADRDVDRAVSVALGPKKWRPEDEPAFRAVHAADIAEEA